MTRRPEGFLRIGGSDLEYRMIGPSPDEAPTLVLLHEGLGSAALWGDFPDRLQEKTGCGVVVYSRAGYGASSPVALPRPLDYMHREALTVLPALLREIGFRRGALVGHSDGASIAAIYAGGVSDPRLCGLALIAPHFVVEAVSIAAIEATKAAYERADLKAKLSRWHDDVDNAFLGWSAAWLDPGFRAWDISHYLGRIRIPVAIVQGEADQYGTMRQIEIAQAALRGPLAVTLLGGTGHSPHRDAPDRTLAAVAELVTAALGAEQAAPSDPHGPSRD